jgi:hypothetical protein
VTVPILRHKTGCAHDPKSKDGFDPRTLEQIKIADEWPALHGSSSSDETRVGEEDDAVTQGHKGNEIVVVGSRGKANVKQAQQAANPIVVRSD